MLSMLWFAYTSVSCFWILFIGSPHWISPLSLRLFLMQRFTNPQKNLASLESFTHWYLIHWINWRISLYRFAANLKMKLVFIQLTVLYPWFQVNQLIHIDSFFIWFWILILSIDILIYFFPFGNLEHMYSVRWLSLYFVVTMKTIRNYIHMLT